MNPKIEYIADENVSEEVDLEMRELLSTCFTKPEDVVFKERRYFREPYPHHWTIRDEKGKLVAHAGLHEKKVIYEEKEYKIGGVCEVAVHPEFRRRGYVKLMLSLIHPWMTENGFAFSVLFGDKEVYSSSGYCEVDNVKYNEEEGQWEPTEVMVCEISGIPWPEGEVYMPGPSF